MSHETPNWGIEPVPDRLRLLGLFDTGLLWSSLGLSLLVLVAGTRACAPISPAKPSIALPTRPPTTIARRASRSESLGTR